MIHFLMICIAKVLIFITVRYKVEGREFIPSQSPFLIVSNHLSVSDPVMIGASLGIRVTFMAKQDLFKNPIAGYFVRQFGAFPVYRGGYNIETLRQANKILQHNEILCMFPEGKRSLGNGLLVGQNGSAMIASHNRVLILPIGINGSEQIHGYSWIWHRPQVTLKIGPSFYLPQNDKNSNKEYLSESTFLIMKRIADLLPEKYRGEYGAKPVDGHNNL